MKNESIIENLLSKQKSFLNTHLVDRYHYCNVDGFSPKYSRNIVARERVNYENENDEIYLKNII